MRRSTPFSSRSVRSALTFRTATLLVVLGLAGAVPAISGVSYYLVTDVPATLGGIDYTPDQILRSDTSIYSVELNFGDSSVQFLALHRLPDGKWLLVPATPVDDGTSGIEPRDVVLFDGVSPVLYFDGSTAGVPDYARIDSVFLDPGGSLVLGFDVPVNLVGTEYSRSDLVRYSAGVFSLFWDAEAAGVPADVNVVGADRDSGGTLVVSFDVPTNLGGTWYLPGQLVRWNGSAFSSYFVDPAWPSSALLGGFGFVPAAGAVPDGGASPGTPLTVNAAAGSLTLSWGPSCATADTDYEIYEGTIGSYYSHTEKFCTTGGATTTTFPQPSGSTYYLVVPKNTVSEGSYGRASSGSERPQGSAACLPQQIALACP